MYNFTNEMFWCFFCLGEATQVPGSRVPYLHGGFSVENLPNGLPFRKPFHYGANQLKAIMEKKDEIKFVIHSSQNPAMNTSEDSTLSRTVTPETVALLAKISDNEMAHRVVESSEKITEEKVEVLLFVDEQERLLLNHCSQFFDDDAWLAVGVNIQHSSQRQGLIISVFTDSDDEDFWLFYSVQTPSKLVKLSNSHKLKGHWLDVQEKVESKYGLLHNNETSIIFANVIKNEGLGPLYLSHRMEIAENQHFSLPIFFKNAIIAALQNYNLM